MLRVYGHYTYFYSCGVGIDFRRQILTIKIDPRTARVKIDEIFLEISYLGTFDIVSLKYNFIVHQHDIRSKHSFYLSRERLSFRNKIRYSLYGFPSHAKKYDH